jgi:phytoene dehydrogenase-like protein
MKTIAIIGSGIGGLTAGNLLAGKGHHVTIFESHTSPGGYTAGFRRKGFYFESGTLAFESSGVFLKTMEDLDLKDSVHLVKAQNRMVSPYYDFRFESCEGFREALAAAFPSEKTAVNACFAEISAVSEAMRPFVKKPYPMQFSGLGTAKAMLPYLTSGPKVFKLFKKYKGQSVNDIADRHFHKGTPLHRLITNLGYPRMGISGLAGYFAMISEDYWHVVEGMQHLADVLADRFRRNGGDLRLGAPVEKILTKDGAAAGVVSRGVPFEADAVISACDFKRTFLELLDDPSLIPPVQLENIRKAAVSEGIFTVYLGLHVSNEELRRSLRAHTVAYSPLAYDLDFEDPNDLAHFSKCGFGLHSLSLINPALAPEGRSSLMIQAICPTRWQNNWHKGDRERYLALKERVKAALIERAESIVPDLGSRIEFEDAATPLTYERYTGNTDGATSAWSWDPRKAFYEGGLMETKSETPVRNLFIGSCWSNQIGGVPSAIAAAYTCAKKIK